MREPCVEPLKKCQDDNVLAFLGETVRYRRCGAFLKKRRSEAILVETKAVELCSISLVYTNCTGGKKRKPERSSMR